MGYPFSIVLFGRGKGVPHCIHTGIGTREVVNHSPTNPQLRHFTAGMPSGVRYVLHFGHFAGSGLGLYEQPPQAHVPQWGHLTHVSSLPHRSHLCRCIVAISYPFIDRLTPGLIRRAQRGRNAAPC